MLGCLYTVNRFSVDKLIKDHLRRDFWGHPYNKQKIGYNGKNNIQSAIFQIFELCIGPKLELQIQIFFSKMNFARFARSR